MVIRLSKKYYLLKTGLFYVTVKDTYTRLHKNAQSYESMPINGNTNGSCDKRVVSDRLLPISSMAHTVVHHCPSSNCHACNRTLLC